MGDHSALGIRDATFREALDFLKKKASEVDEENINTVPSAFLPLKIPPSAPESSATPASAAWEKRITLSLRDVSFYDALEKITTLAGVRFWVRADGIHTSLTEPKPAQMSPDGPTSPAKKPGGW